MAIGFSSSYRLFQMTVLFVLGFDLLALRSSADDQPSQIQKRDGSVISVIITGVSGTGNDRQVAYTSKSSSGTLVKGVFYVTDIASITMDPPPEVAALKDDAKPDVVIATLEPQIAKYSGLPIDWVVNSMAEVANAYLAQGHPEKSLAIFQQIDVLYPNSKYHSASVAGIALMNLKQGKLNDALVALQPVIAQANQSLLPRKSDGGTYASAFLTYGQILEVQKKPSQALEAYLTVKTIFYQNDELVQEADQLAAKLREKNPGLGVD